jgi:hypothetical protein
MTPAARARPGAIVQVRIQGVWHEGLIAEEAPARSVIHKSKRTGRVVEEPIADFAAGATVRVMGYPGRLEGSEVLRRARARIGEPWSWAGNCQRYTRGCQGVPSRSPDMERTAIAGVIGAMLSASLLGGR